MKRITDYLSSFVPALRAKEPEPADDMRVVKSPDGKFAVQAWSKWTGWILYGFREFDSEESARDAIVEAKEYRAKQKEREAKAWRPIE